MSVNSTEKECKMAEKKVDKEEKQLEGDQKTAEQEARLKSSLMKSFMFAALAPDDLVTVVQAFKEFQAASGTTVITQGAKVDAVEPGLFVIESGKLNVFKDGGETPVFTYTEPGQYFGVLALLYNAPRAATVTAETDSVLWSIDRTTFNQFVVEASRKATERRMNFLAKVECFKGLTPDEMANLCDNLQPKIVDAGTAIIKTGEEAIARTRSRCNAATALTTKSLDMRKAELKEVKQSLERLVERGGETLGAPTGGASVLTAPAAPTPCATGHGEASGSFPVRPQGDLALQGDSPVQHLSSVGVQAAPFYFCRRVPISVLASDGRG